MVSTRLKTNSLPEKKVTLADLQAEEAEVRRISRAQKPKPISKKPKTVEAPDIKQRPAIKASKSKLNVDKPEPDPAPGTKKAKSKAVSTPTESYRSHPANSPPRGEDAITFLDLPAEIRNEIFVYTLGQPRAISIRLVRPYLPEPALCAVSRQVRSEALGIFYGENVIDVNGSSPAVKFMRSMPQDALRALRTLHITCDNLRPVKEAQERIRQLFREFGPRGLRRQAVRFLVEDDGDLVWANLEKLKRLSEGE